MEHQLTLQELYDLIGKAIKEHPAWAKKKVITASDNEGNDFHGMWFGVTGEPRVIKEFTSSRGWEIQDSETQDPNKLVIVG